MRRQQRHRRPDCFGPTEVSHRRTLGLPLSATLFTAQTVMASARAVSLGATGRPIRSAQLTLGPGGTPERWNSIKAALCWS